MTFNTKALRKAHEQDLEKRWAENNKKQKEEKRAQKEQRKTASDAAPRKDFKWPSFDVKLPKKALVALGCAGVIGGSIFVFNKMSSSETKEPVAVVQSPVVKTQIKNPRDSILKAQEAKADSTYAVAAQDIHIIKNKMDSTYTHFLDDFSSQYDNATISSTFAVDTTEILFAEQLDSMTKAHRGLAIRVSGNALTVAAYIGGKEKAFFNEPLKVLTPTP